MKTEIASSLNKFRMLVKRIDIRLIALFIVCLGVAIFALMRLVNKQKLLTTLDNMYYIDLVETKEKYLLLEVETNPLLSIDLSKENLEYAILHFKSGEIYDVIVDTDNSLFLVDSGTNNILKNRVFKYNKTLESKLKKEENENKDEISELKVLEN